MNDNEYINFRNSINYREVTLKKRADEIYAADNEYNKSRENHYFERTGTNSYRDNRRYKPEYCHVFINNISFPQSLEEIKDIYIDERGCYDIEDLVESNETTWTSPKWAMAGDVCLFMHAKTASSTISRLKTELMRSKDFYSETDYKELLSWLEKGKRLYNKYGGKIFAVAQVIGPAEEDKGSNGGVHWSSRIYSDMGMIWLLEHPIDISQFREYVVVSNRGAITPVLGKEYSGLKGLILEYNQNPPEYFVNAVAADAEMSRINRESWLRTAPQFLHSFIYEKQFRLYYVDYFLSTLGDIKTIYSECRCVKKGVTDLSRVDNVIKFCGRYLPVEVKLSVPFEYNIVAQVSKYCNDDEVFLDKSEARGVKTEYLYHNHVLIIDTENLFLYDDRTGVIEDIYDLSDIHTIDDITSFREMLFGMLASEYEPIKQHLRQRQKRNEKRLPTYRLSSNKKT